MANFSRRNFLQTAASTAVAIHVVPLHKALAELQTERQHQPPNWIRGGRIRFRQDGIPKVTGNKVFAIDIRARDMPGWPEDQSHALILRADRADRRFEGFNDALLPDDLRPDVIVTDAEVQRDGVTMTQEDFYGRLFLPRGEAPRYLGQPVAVLIYHDYARFRRAKGQLQFNPDALLWGGDAELPEMAPYGGARFVRIGGETPDAPDRFSPLSDTLVFADFENASPWPDADAQGDAGGRAMAHAKALREELQSPPENWAVYQGRYASQYVDPAALEPDNGNAWYDPENGALHVVVGTQSPFTNADHIEKMVSNSRFDLSELRLHPGYTVGYGQKEHHVLPYYVALAALYGEGRPVRLALDRYSHFQGAIKRHPFQTEMTLAVDRETGMFQSLAADLRANGGGVKNFSPSVGQVAASALQGIHYFPKSDIAVQVDASRAPTAGSMRGYGTLQSMVGFELLVDEVAEDLGLDPIELRRRNLMHSGMKNTQGAIPAGTLRAGELLDAAQADPLWTGRAERKRQFEVDNPGYLYGVGVSCVQKDYGTGAEAALVQLEITPDGRLHMKHVASEIGCGSTTSQMLMTERHLGRYADSVDFAVTDWPSLPLQSNDEPYTMSQEEQDEAASDPHWVPRITSPRSASNSAYYFSHATNEAARLLFDLGLWQAALGIWQDGIGGGQAAPLAIRRDQAEWRDGHLVASGLQPLSFAELARRAHDRGLITGVTVHTFNRWAWATGEFEVDGERVSGAIDALSVKWGEGASTAKKARMRDGGYAFQPRKKVNYPPVQRNNASVVYYAPLATIVELSVNPGSGEVQILSHKSWMECGNMIVPELVSGQLQGGIAMGIGHALYEELPLYEDGPGNGTWNFNRYRLPRARDVAVWSQQGEVIEPLSATDPPKGIAEVVMIPVVAAIVNAVHDATGARFHETPLTPDRIKEALS
ncbi:xanthine dehydrogenase family protein molybdopterin-binding subunit [Oceaniglobus trochenteri]|uniref:xanthine dehydrogenase family protein molybdopterin-binding subunit n=1 Tax=Oceaniglobus trochenteri TaxID=2763260 RepID=UPI001CFFFEEB|nr:molybdopterin cofactor-binding domain-containing protein [Oceaniglobus trochenteri]